MDEVILILLGLVALGWLLIGPIVSLVLWARVSRLNHEVQRLARLSAEALRAGVARPVAPSAPSLAREISSPAAPETPVELVAVESVPESTFDSADLLLKQQMAAAAGRPPASATPAPSQPAAPGFSLEELLAGKWLTWVGALAVVIGVGFFFKYTIDQGLLGPTGRVVVGILAGMIAFAGGAFAMLRNYRFFAQGLVGAALGILYFSLFAAFGWYQIIPQNLAFVGMALVTAAALAFSTYFNAQPTAILGLLGGFLTPIMLSTGQDAQWSLFSYVFLLDLGVLGVATFRKWQPLQVLALVLTAGMWLGWFEQHYQAEKLPDTLILMTAFFLLFALLGIWYNVVRREPAQPGDFFVVLATPVIYFIGVYAVTLDKYSYLHGLMAIGMAGAYLALGLFALTRNPAGRRVVIALGGVAASFLTVAIPLQLTGHWIAIAWALESLLLVELGLRFGERKLRWAGLGLLVVVQFILFFYAAATINDPLEFRTDFSQFDPVTLDVMSGTEITNPRTAPPEVAPPLWMQLLNGRLLSFLASALVMSVMAWEYRRRPEALAETVQTFDGWNASTLVGILLTAIPITVFVMLGLETFVFSERLHWLSVTLLSGLCFWAALVALAVVVVAAWRGPNWYVGVGLAGFVLLFVMLGISFLMSLDVWRSDWSRLQEVSDATRFWRWPVVNPRGLSFLVAIVAAVAGSYVCRAKVGPTADAEWNLFAGSFLEGFRPAELLGLFAHLTGLAMLTIEVYAQGVIRDWGTGTALAITFTWTLYATSTLIAGIYYRTALVRILALALFLLTTGKVFLYDVWHLHTTIRTLAFICLGLSLLLVSFLYRRFRDRIRAWIQPVALLLLAPAVVSLAASQAAAAETPLRAQQLIESLAERWPIKVGELPPGDLAYVELPLDLYGFARNDLSDLRVLAIDSQGLPVEVPYLLVIPSDRSQLVERTAPLLNLSELDGKTQFLLDVGEAAQPINRLEIVIDKNQHNYNRTVQVFGADSRDAAEWNLLSKNSYVLDVKRPSSHFRVNQVDFPQSQFHFYKVVIDNAGQPPLKIETARVFELHKYEAPRQTVPGRIAATTEQGDRDEQTLIVDLKFPRIPTSSAEFHVTASGNFYRLATLDVADDNTPRTTWQTVASSPLYRIERDDVHATRTELKYPPTPGRYLRLRINNGDDAALVIDRCSAKVIIHRVVLPVAQLADRKEVALYVGNAKLGAPSYDLARTAGDVERALFPELTLLPAERNPKYLGPLVPDAPWSERNQPLLWALTGAGVLILGGLTILLLRKAAANPPSE